MENNYCVPVTKSIQSLAGQENHTMSLVILLIRGFEHWLASIFFCRTCISFFI